MAFRNRAEGRVILRIDPSTSKVIARIPPEGVPLTQVDPRTNTLRRQFVGGKQDDTLRVGFGSAWIVDEPHGQIGRVDLAKLNELP